jgi:hypothetical protein
MGHNSRTDIEPTTLPPPCADCLEIWEIYEPVQTINGIALTFYTLYMIMCCLVMAVAYIGL